ncbi:MAG TPA: NAD(P)/FAD-dependent oxidoreductase [bacterium]|nr:NAD(P)/FAD-dependent oxidoreductase [bacterium]
MTNLKPPMKPFDVAIIGAGVVGCAIARQLSRYTLQCVLIDSEPDLGMGTSKASTAIWHTGFDAKPGTLEARLLTRSYHLLEDYVPQAGIAYERSGAVLVAWNEDQFNALPGLLAKAHENGVRDVHLLSVDQVYELEPRLNAGALGGLMVPGESIICTYGLPLAMATEAAANGVALQFGFPVKSVASGEGAVQLLSGPAGSLACRYVINAAGLYSDEIDRLYGYTRFTVTPRRGELIVFDKFARPLVNHVLLPIPTGKTKGVLVSPTVYGNVMLGPTAEDLKDKTQKGTSNEGLDFLWKKGEAILSPLMKEEVTATYAGLRAATEHSDYQIFPSAEQRYICVGGIRSTGISASLGIAEYVQGLLEEMGVALQPKAEYQSVRLPPLGEAQTRPYRSESAIAADPDFGRIVCHCERVTAGEIKNALNSAIPATTLDGLRRRTRCMQGRCQGFHCHADVSKMLADHLGVKPASLIGYKE